jgi:hypothetical protein
MSKRTIVGHNHELVDAPKDLQDWEAIDEFGNNSDDRRVWSAPNNRQVVGILKLMIDNFDFDHIDIMRDDFGKCPMEPEAMPKKGEVRK